MAVGDTLYKIALKNNTTVADIKAANNLVSDIIYPGQTLAIPGGTTPPSNGGSAPTPGNPSQPPDDSAGVTHQVARGDTLFLIAKKYGVSVQDIKTANGLVSDMLN